MSSDSILKDKLGGSHTTVIGGRSGKKILRTVSQHPNVKRIIPSVISVRGKSASGGSLSAKILRPDSRGNLRLLLSQGTSSQEIRLVTNIGDFEEGEKLMEELNDILSEYR
ncbi:hypothetical protein J2755_000343 [Methanohalophilus levihalophilus]|uniref:DUF2103 domain-containing protein n=1 Tax=Methanohalophilus levihalophilus TaxID=1431282 RepID=UPI001AE3AB4B|nr:DUF2103 domain-containing protein [Methanohalophilus levihalophilus]MBP2029423.1 hypothetical protein [Methanohalophilus levihalophilus]